MRTITPIRRVGHHECCLPLFNWADRHERNHLPRPARIIAARYGLSPDHARIVARLAGFSADRRE